MSTSLYRCPSCRRVVRYDSWRRALGCMCDALPLGSDPGFWDPPFGHGRIGPPRPYYPDRENLMEELPDDGRDGVEDLREGTWLA
jgi:hypothetical protein